MESLPPRAEEALEILGEHIGGESGLSEAAAIQILTDAGFDENQAERVVEYLHDAGYLYQVDGTFHLTSPE